MSRSKRNQPVEPPAGHIRQSQVVTTWGPGAMIDLPDQSALIGGLDFWMGEREPIDEPRLAQLLSRQLGRTLRLEAPPIEPGGIAAIRRHGIPAVVFPRYFLAQVEETYRESEQEAHARGGSPRTYRTRPIVHFKELEGQAWIDYHGKRQRVVPVRFVQACEQGHLDDIDWNYFVNGPNHGGQLWLDEGGSSDDLTDIWVRDAKTGRRRQLADAKLPESVALGRCTGSRPWLGRPAREHCDVPARLLVRGASNAYFVSKPSVISIPHISNDLTDTVARLHDTYLSGISSAAQLASLRAFIPQIRSALGVHDDDDVWAAVERHRRGPPPGQGVKHIEIETFMAVPESSDGSPSTRPSPHFLAGALPRTQLSEAARRWIDRVVLVHRLREVEAQVGFTRFKPLPPNLEGELDYQGVDISVRLAAIARELEWLPAVERRGEGLFLALSKHALHDEWLTRKPVQTRIANLRSAWETWCTSQGIGRDARHFNPIYIALHTLAHVLLTTLALECGYAVSAIRERIYAGPQAYGILLYTGAPGTQGTLGGLIAAGHEIERHLATALTRMRLCSNDPVCSGHDPRSRSESRHLHGAACHACTMVPETSCEQSNLFLDRALVVPTVDTPDAALFMNWP